MTDKPDYSYSRRKMLGTMLTGLTAASVPSWFINEAHAEEMSKESLWGKRYGSNDQINIAVIGPGGSRGGFRQGLGDTHNAKNHPGTKIVAACDVDKLHREEAAASFGADCAKYSDFREVLARKDIDAVVIGTPDHWHSIIAIAAMKAGKDVYCEKPLTLTIDEGKHIVAMQKKTKRIFQVGSQQRSDGRFRLACELVRNGRLGKLQRVIAHLPGGTKGGPFDTAPIPDGFDWDMWQGQTPDTPYIPQRTHGSFRHWLEYSGGMMTDWGAHHNDISQWGIGADRSGPISIEAVAKRQVAERCYNAFLEFKVTYTYADDVTLTATNEGENGVHFYGEKGWIFVSRGEIKASDPALITDPLPASATKLYVSNDHMGNFLDGIRTRTTTICDAETGHRSASVCHLGNLCMTLGGGKLDWDPVHEHFIGSHEANKLLSRPIRGGWKLS